MAEITIADATPRVQYTVGSTPTTGPYTIPWPYYDEDDILVYVDDTLQTITTDYTVSGTAVDDGFSGGSITFVSSISSVTVTLRRDIPVARVTDFPSSGPFDIAALNTQLDKSYAILQQYEETINRSLVRALTSTETYSLDWPDGATATGQALLISTSGLSIGPSAADISGAAANAAAASTSATNAATSETNAASSEAAAAAAAQGWADVVSVTTGTTNIETTDARKYYILDASGGTITINLPAVGTTDGLTLGFEVLDASNSITIVRDGTDTINGAASNYTGLTGVGDVVHFISVDGTPDDWSARLISRFVVDGTTITQSGRTISVGTGGVDSAQIADGAIDPVHISGSINAQTGTTYTFVIGDAFKVVTCTNASAVAVTIPTNASVAFPVGARLDVLMGGAGAVTLTGDSGVVVNGVSAGGAAISAQYSGISLLKTATDTWIMFGNHATVA